ncbi:fatty acyl-AMP ligase [Nocardioides panacisoli]|uniref:Fatty acyl-AMP ligase n=2 Tax=Nocardioides panacisoli TaxID=627624 RepID=A0ABP7J7W6_9ACTN
MDMAIPSAPAQDGLPSGTDIVERLAEWAETQPDRLLYVELLDGVAESARLTAAELETQAAQLAGLLEAKELHPGDVVLLIATRPAEFLVGLFGCMWAGVIAAPISFPRRPDHLHSRLEPVRANAGAVAVVAATPQGPAEVAVLEKLTEGNLPVVHLKDAASADPVPPAAEREIAYLQYTSGSTSEPRGVTVTHANLAANLEVSREVLAMTPDSVNVSWCPLTHDMGLVTGALTSVWLGMKSVIMPPSAFIRRPLTWLRAVDRYRGTHSCSPNFGFDLCVDRSTPEERAALDLSSAVTFINGAEPVRRRTRDRFLEAFAPSGFPPGAHCPGYGLAEATVVVSATPPGDPGTVLWVDADALEKHQLVLREEGEPDVRELCTDGVLGSGYDARIVDPDTFIESEPHAVGELWLRGPSVSPGYWRREEATKEAFGAHLADGTGPYLRTGDLAFLHDGAVVICGRAKDLIVIRGRNIYPQDIEQSTELAHEALRLGGSAAFAVEGESGAELESLVLVSEVDGEPDEREVAAAIRSVVLREYDLHVSDVLLVPPYSVPKTSSGKKQRSASKRLWQSARAHS